MMDGFTSLEEDEDDVILCKPVGTGSPLPPLHSGVLEGYNYFGDLLNPDPEDDSLRSHEGDFVALSSHNMRCSRRFSKQKKVDIFCTALGVNIDVLLGNSPPPPIVDIYRTFHKDMWRKGQWKMDRIALPVYHLAKFFHECVEEQSRTCSRVNSRIKALIVMYQYFQDKVTRVERECESTVVATRKGMEKKLSRKSLPNGFKFYPRMVSRQWLDDGLTMARRAQQTNGLMARYLDRLDDGLTDLWLDILAAG
jgi:hypothetical protein